MARYVEIMGRPPLLDATNTGRWSGRGSRTAEATYWRLHHLAVAHWPSIALVNVKDSYHAGTLYPLGKLWTELLTDHGYTIVDCRDVPTPGHRHGANHTAHVDTEHVLVARRP